MLKTILFLLLPLYGICQSSDWAPTRDLICQYECVSPTNGKTQELRLFKNDSFYYKVNNVMNLPGVYRMSGDSLILTSSKLPAGYPIIFHIMGKKLVAFNGHREEPQWYLERVKVPNSRK
jgi:hypothetical protein